MTGSGIFLLGAGALVLLWRGSRTSESLQATLRQWYLRRALPHVARLALPNAPIWALSLTFFGLTFVVPFWALRYFALAAVDLVAFAMILAYFRPTWLMPKWLRDEVASGMIPRAEPMGLDWLYFWFMVPAVAGATIFVLSHPALD